MNAIPEEFNVILNRLKELSIKKVLIEKDGFDYQEAVWRFRVVASNPAWKAASEMFAEKIHLLFRELYEAKYKKYADVKQQFVKVENEDIIYKKLEKSGIEIQILPKRKKTILKEITDEDRKQWFENIFDELLAYESLCHKENLSLIRKLIPIEDAIKIAEHKVTKINVLFDQDVKVKKSLIRLLSDKNLFDYEIRQMKIILSKDSTLATRAKELKKLHSSGLLPYTLKELQSFECFYHLSKTGQLIPLTARAYSNEASRNSRK